jgi:hypothetical protein
VSATGSQRKKKKVGKFLLVLDQILGTGTFSKVYYGEAEPNALEELKKMKYIDQN